MSYLPSSYDAASRRSCVEFCTAVMCVCPSRLPEASVIVPVSPLRSTCAAQRLVRKHNALSPIETRRRRNAAELPANGPCFSLARMAFSKRRQQLGEQIKRFRGMKRARCTHRNRNPDVQVVTVGNLHPSSRLRAENLVGLYRSGLSNVTGCARLDHAQRCPRTSATTIAEPEKMYPGTSTPK